jgi:hypothetical protein
MIMKTQFNLIFLFTFLLFSNIILGQQSYIENIEQESCNRISIYTEPVEGVYKNFWYAYKLDNRELVIISEGKTKEVRAFILFNCENKKYVLYASTNFGRNITEEEFNKIVPGKVIDLSRKIICL